VDPPKTLKHSVIVGEDGGGLMNEKSDHLLGLKDVAEIAVGSVVLAFPIAVTEEVWNLSDELPLGRILFISLGSILFVSLFIYYLFYQSNLQDHWRDFLKRIGTVYLVTLFMSALILFAVDKLEITTNPVLAIKRTVIVALPASFSATVVDSLR
jgi:uncharacterized membrane protein